ncbi:MAG TPA: biotin--[acetyl-CoA-carboxylase] ligase [Solirubrobacteraceae bacterium]|nr:biotin--[acetyl-CoA-carboxylase] ligase [Solirubrobacteraceae bacterium]
MSAPLGHPRLHLRRTDSTNERARALALAGAPHGTLVTAAEQTAGRGRQGRHWSAPAGSALLMSLLLRWPISDRSPALLPLAAAVAVCDVTGPDARIKWPNDIVIEREPDHDAPVGGAPALAKLAGILIEGRPQEGWAVLGIGVNVAIRIGDLPPELRDTAATLGREPGAIEPLLAELLAALERRLGDTPAQTLDAWRERDTLRGRAVSWLGGRGRAQGIDGDGRLVVTLPGGGHAALDAGEVHLALD